MHLKNVEASVSLLTVWRLCSDTRKNKIHWFLPDFLTVACYGALIHTTLPDSNGYLNSWHSLSTLTMSSILTSIRVFFSDVFQINTCLKKKQNLLSLLSASWWFSLIDRFIKVMHGLVQWNPLCTSRAAILFTVYNVCFRFLPIPQHPLNFFRFYFLDIVCWEIL